MRVREDLDLAMLENYGFTRINKKHEEENEEYTICYYDHKYEIGHARRGQFYYLLVDSERNIYIYASQPDGDGCEISCPNVLIDLITHGIVIK